MSVVTDAAGHTHIAASDLTSVYYLTDAGGAWTRTELSSAPTGGADIEPVIAIAPDGGLAVAFTRWSVWTGWAGNTLGEIEGIYFTHNGDSGWSEPGQVPGFGQRPALAFWNDSWSVIATQFDGTFWQRKDGPSWLSRKIGDAGSAGAQFVVDGAGVGHVVLVVKEELVHVTRNGKLADEPVPGTDGATRPRLALDTGGRVHLVYTGGVGQMLHRTLEGDSWTTPEQIDVGGAESFEVSGTDDLQFAYLKRFAESGADLAYASYVGGSATEAPVASISVLPRPAGEPAMSVDLLGRPHIVYATLGDATGVYVIVGPTP